MTFIHDDQIEQLLADVNDIKTVLKGYNGYRGLCQRHEDLAEDYFRLKRWVMCVFFFMVGAGILTGSAVGIFKMLGG